MSNEQGKKVKITQKVVDICEELILTSEQAERRARLSQIEEYSLCRQILAHLSIIGCKNVAPNTKDGTGGGAERTLQRGREILRALQSVQTRLLELVVPQFMDRGEEEAREAIERQEGERRKQLRIQHKKLFKVGGRPELVDTMGKEMVEAEITYQSFQLSLAAETLKLYGFLRKCKRVITQ